MFICDGQWLEISSAALTEVINNLAFPKFVPVCLKTAKMLRLIVLFGNAVNQHNNTTGSLECYTHFFW